MTHSDALIALFIHEEIVRVVILCIHFV